MWLVVLNALGRVRPALDLVRAGVRVGVVVLVQVAEGVVDFAVLALVGADVQQQIAHRAVSLGHRPVLDRNVRRRHLLPQWQAAGVKVCDLAGVGDDGFFFEVADEAVAGAWGDEVGDEHEVEEESGGVRLVYYLVWLGDVETLRGLTLGRREP
jgi:hypothetical protein